MSIFGQAQTQAPATGGLFGQPAAANKPSPFGGATGGGLFGNTATTNTTQSTTGGLFGGATQTQQPAGGLFGGAATTQAQPSGGLFGGATTTQTQQPSGGLFGGATNTQTQQPSGGLFGGAIQQKPATGGLFGNLGTQQPQQQQQQQTGGSLFGQKPLAGMLGQPQQQQQQTQQQGGGLFGGLGQTQQPQQQQQQQPSLFAGSLLGGQQQQPQLGQTQMGQTQMGQSTAQGSSLWEPGRAVTGVHRTVPMQIQIVKDKWDASSRSSPFRAYLYNNVGDEMAPFYQPGPEDDDTKWEDALRKRPDTGYVPVLVKGFFELGKRAQRQKDFLTMMQTRLHEINNCLSDLLSRHDLKISVKIADCRRKHLVLSKRCLALAAKTQVLRNRGYAMDDAEEELKKKLSQLERSVFDPSLNGRGEEVWARMLAIREHSRRLQQEMERAGPSAAAQADDELDEQTMKTAKKILDDYHTQIQHLQKELDAVKKDFEEAQKLPGMNH
ncbi:putative nucleoporin [Aspergillus ibericus CBS 121593]|uniref:Nucleoporin Nup54 alpha-helical domain-containing protein n=1 Tax=Aspergillus ibericus CBS 121593 TaxID=1448316 RepID=A0A395GJ87_9EURO|nr:hypothetical protein BO80DRAFT_469313 [Aspergillus ibericus CBS 121593]RAK95550.1 hypothetical protein BO80DRAFT_469313 [Aspergillus ibericus CBS 121593]